jgi:stress-induced morphogen
MAMAASEIESMIQAALPDAVIEITDLAGDNNHFAAKVTSASFEGMSRLARTRAVYAALGGRMGEELHALQLTTATPA